MFVVVFLCDARKNIVVPQSFIFGLSQQLLNNYGRSRSRKFLIFWSKNAIIGDNDEPMLNFTPNFALNVSATFPPERDECCYIGQIRYFFGKCDFAYINIKLVIV